MDNNVILDCNSDLYRQVVHSVKKFSNIKVQYNMRKLNLKIRNYGPKENKIP